jgi:hypothetical protein
LKRFTPRDWTWTKKYEERMDDETQFDDILAMSFEGHEAETNMY